MYKIGVVAYVQDGCGGICTRWVWWHMYKMGVVAYVQDGCGRMCVHTRWVWWHTYKMGVVAYMYTRQAGSLCTVL